MATRPTEQDILDAVFQCSPAMTIHVTGRLRRQHGYDLKTGWVLGRLYKLEAEGKVKQVATVYRVQKRWALTK